MSRFDFGIPSGRGMGSTGGMGFGRKGACFGDASGNGSGQGRGMGRGLRNGQCRLDATSGRGGFFGRFQNEGLIDTNSEQSTISRLQSTIDALQRQIAELKKQD